MILLDWGGGAGLVYMRKTINTSKSSQHIDLASCQVHSPPINNMLDIGV